MLIGWGEFALALSVFFLSHSIPARPGLKRALIKKLGRGGYGAVYGVISVAALAWLILAAGRAPFVPLGAINRWQLAAPLLLMAPATLLVAFAIYRPNPYSFGGKSNERFNANCPGVIRITCHPFLAAVGLWAAGHAIANPDLAHAIVFGSFVVSAILGMVMINARHRDMVVTVPQEPMPAMGATQLAARFGGACILYCAVVLMHPILAGVDLAPILSMISS